MANESARIWRAWEGFTRTEATRARRELRQVEADRDISDEARDRRRREILDAYQARHRAALETVRAEVDEAMNAYLYSLPDAVETAAAMKTPSRAVELRQLAAGAPIPALREIVLGVVNGRDLAGAAGVRQALQAHPGKESDPGTITDLIRDLDSITAPSRERYLGELVSARWYFAHFKAMGAGVDPNAALTKDPAALLTEVREAGAVPVDRAGGVRHLSDAEVNRLMDLVASPRAVPGEG